MLCSQFDTLSLRYASFDLIEKMSLFWSTPIISIITIQEATFSVKRRVLANHFTAGICYLSLFLKYTKGVTASRSCYLYNTALKMAFHSKVAKGSDRPVGWLNLNIPLIGKNRTKISYLPRQKLLQILLLLLQQKSPIGKENATIFEKDLKQKRKEELLYTGN